MTTLEVRDLRWTQGGHDILAGVNLTVTAGQRLAVTGPSGSGKTSLLALLAGLAAPSAGQVSYDGVPLIGMAGAAQGVAVVLQGYGLVSLLTAAENVEVALRATGWSPADAVRQARTALTNVGLEAQAGQLIEELSGGQQQRTAVARALALRPRLLIADEPTAELDPAARTLVLARMLEITDAGAALILATHDPEVAARCHDVVDLHR